MADVDVTAATPAAPPASPKARQVDYGEAAERLSEKIIEEARMNPARQQRDRQDWWNLKLYRGGAHQWDIWDPSAGRYVPRGTDPARGGIPAYVPRSVTNLFATKIDGVASILDQTSPAKEVGPASAEDTDRAAAEVAESAIPVLFQEMGFEQDRGQVHKAIALTSGVAYSLYYDNDAKYGTDAIAALQCTDPECAQYALPADVEDNDFRCPDCGAEMQDAIDPRTGMVIAQDFPKGKLCGKLSYSFEYSLPARARTTDTTRLPWVATHTRLPLDECERRWPNIKGKIQPDAFKKTEFQGSEYADAMAGLVAPVGDHRSQPHAAGGGPVVYELWHDPIESEDFYFPDGLYLVRVDTELAHAGPLEYVDEDGKPIKNVLIRQYQNIPGNASGKPPGDDLGPLQVQRNIVESMIDLGLMHYASPKEYIPMSVTLLDKPTGAPGERIRIRTTVPGEAPVVVEGKSPSSGLFERLDRIDSAMDTVSKLNAVLAGERPEGDPTLGEVQILRERGMSAFREPLDELIRFECALATMALRITRQCAWTPRYYKLRGDDGSWEVQKFLGADLAGRYDVYIDKAAAWPKSPMLRQMRLKEAFEIGALPNPVSQDPEVHAKVLSELDLAGFKQTMSKDYKQIQRELDRWREAQTPDQIAPPNPLIQNLLLHFALKQAFMKTEEGERMAVDRPEVFQACLMHLSQLQMALAPPAPAPAGEGQPADPMGSLVGAGVLKPAGAKADPMGGLVKSGVLKPAGPAAPNQSAGGANAA